MFNENVKSLLRKLSFLKGNFAAFLHVKSSANTSNTKDVE